MKLSRFLHVLLVAAFAVLSACSNSGLFPNDKIDPAGNLSRQDYLALRQREKLANQQHQETGAPIQAATIAEAPAIGGARRSLKFCA